MSRREALPAYVLARFRDEAVTYARTCFKGRDTLAGNGIAWDDPAAAWDRLRPDGAGDVLDARIRDHWRTAYRQTCKELGSSAHTRM